MRLKNEPGFCRIDVPDGRRGLWMRVTRGDDGAPQKIELCAGREGDDAEVSISVGDTVTRAMLLDLELVLLELRYAREIADGRA